MGSRVYVSPEKREEVPVYHHMYGSHDGWDWFWMVPMMLLWIAVLGGVVYAAVRLAIQHSHDQKPPLRQ